LSQLGHEMSKEPFRSNRQAAIVLIFKKF